MAEFQPGVPWKGIQSSGDPDSDPYMTPGSVLGSPGPPSLNDSDHQLLRDNIGPNPSLNTSLPSPGAWPYSASDSPLSNAHSTGICFGLLNFDIVFTSFCVYISESPSY